MQSRGILLTLVFLFTSFASAFQWGEIFGDKVDGVLVARQQSNPSSNQPSSTQQSGSATGSGSVSASNSGSAAPSMTGSASLSSGKGGSTVSIHRNMTKPVDPRLPPGGVSMLTPAATDGMTFVKVGDQVTFKWNYTSLSRAPSYIDVIATNTVNSQTYTIAYNQSFQSTQSVVWDTNEFTQTTDLPFVVATYTLMIYDANSEPTAVPSAGDLGAFSNLQFGVYTPQPYTPLSDFRCATCSNGAMSIHEKQALGVILGTCTITVLSFTWFASGVLRLF